MKVFTLATSFIAAVYAAEAVESVESAEANAAAWEAYEALTAKDPQGQRRVPPLSESALLDGAKLAKTILGPYTIQSSKMTKVQRAARYTCPHMGGCLVTGMEATIRYADGAVANTDTGAWMHHIAMFGALGNSGNKFSLSGGGAGGIWAAGNERPTLRLNSKSYKYGLDFTNYLIIIDLMSEEAAPKNVTLEITYETVPKNRNGYKAAQMMWLTIGEPKAKQGVYKFNSIPMSVKSAGQLLYAIGHMHDGGTDMTLTVGGQEKCKSQMYYTTGKKAPGGHSHKMKRQHNHGGGMGAEHIDYPGACQFFGDVSAGTMLRAVANYDATKHPLMMHNGKPENLMGNMRVYVGPS